MKKGLLLLFFTSSFTVYSFAQSAEQQKRPSKNNGVSVSLGINLPVDDFSSTHFMGIGVDFSPASHWFGLLKRKKIAFTYTGGAAYYFGKKETVSSYPYQYPGYLFIHAFAGVLYNPVQKAGLKLTAGPALGIYNGSSQFNIGSRLEASYYINKMLSVGPGILFMKESGADPIWSASFKATLDL